MGGQTPVYNKIPMDNFGNPFDSRGPRRNSRFDTNYNQRSRSPPVAPAPQQNFNQAPRWPGPINNRESFSNPFNSNVRRAATPDYSSRPSSNWFDQGSNQQKANFNKPNLVRGSPPRNLSDKNSNGEFGFDSMQVHDKRELKSTLFSDDDFEFKIQPVEKIQENIENKNRPRSVTPNYRPQTNYGSQNYPLGGQFQSRDVAPPPIYNSRIENNWNRRGMNLNQSPRRVW